MGLPVWENPRLVSRLFLKNAIKNSLTFLKAERQGNPYGYFASKRVHEAKATL